MSAKLGHFLKDGDVLLGFYRDGNLDDFVPYKSPQTLPRELPIFEDRLYEVQEGESK